MKPERAERLRKRWTTSSKSETCWPVSNKPTRRRETQCSPSRPAGSMIIGYARLRKSQREWGQKMATATARQQQQTPLEEAGERIAEGMPGMYLAAKAVGLEDHRRMLADHARRVRSDYNRLNRAAGGRVADGDGDDMGNITITGDINVADARQASRILDRLGNENGNGKPAPTTAASPQPSALAKLAPWALAAGIGLGGAGLGTMLLNRPAEPPEVAPDATEIPRYDVEKWTPAQ